MFRFTIRDVLWLTVVVALAVGWVADRWVLHRKQSVLTDQCDDQQWKLDALVKLIEQRDGKVVFGDDGVSLYIVAKDWSAGPGWSSLERK